GRSTRSTRQTMTRAFACVLASAALACAGCAPRARYSPPAAAAPPEYKENASWKPAQPADATIRGKWWEIFGDPDLNAFEEQLAVSNQTLKIAAAQYEQARAFLRGSRAGFYPQVGVDPSI